MSGRPDVIFLTWTFRDGRAREIARSLGGEAYAVFPRRLSGRRMTPLRYLTSALLTIAHLTRRRPRTVIVTNPPVAAGLVVRVWCTLARASYALDSHPTSFGAKGHRQSRRFLPLHRWLVRRAVTTMVTTDHWAETVKSWGGHALLIHEAPAFEPSAGRELRERPQVLFVGIFSPDEPVDEVIEAARGLPGVDFVITGDLKRWPEDRPELAPDNVTFSGYLAAEAYEKAIVDADVVLALTTEPTSVMRAAYEAVYAGKPLVLSDTPALRPLFRYGVFVSNDAGGIRAGLDDAIGRHEQLRATADMARREQLLRWEDQLTNLRERLRS